MKTRLGFVSNSSSSSFIICRAAVGHHNFETISEKINLLYDDMYESDWILEENHNYIFLKIQNVGVDDVNDILEELDLPHLSYMTMFS